MAFKTGKLVVDGDDIDTKNAYKNADDVPGYKHLVEHGYHDCIAYLKQILNKPALCLQVVDTRQTGKVVVDENGDTVAGYGWKFIQHLGKGKDGNTFWGYRYGDASETKHVIKIKTQYSKNFDNHTQIFNAMLRKILARGDKKPRALLDQVVKNDYNHYKSKAPFSPIKPEKREIHKSLRDVCEMNSWSIQNTGFVFWDMGYSNGRNFMKDNNNLTRWVDYGGAGMLQCPNFLSVYKQYKGLPVLELGENKELHQELIKGKDSLVIGNSDFVMCQFLLNYEFWSEPETTADLYSSILQVKRQVIPEIVELLPKLIKTKLGKIIYNEYSTGWNWLEDTTWRSLGKLIDENT
jgi:hypothetical protein